LIIYLEQRAARGGLRGGDQKLSRSREKIGWLRLAEAKERSRGSRTGDNLDLEVGQSIKGGALLGWAEYSHRHHTHTHTHSTGPSYIQTRHRLLLGTANLSLRNLAPASQLVNGSGHVPSTSPPDPSHPPHRRPINELKHNDGSSRIQARQEAKGGHREGGEAPYGKGRQSRSVSRRGTGRLCGFHGERICGQALVPD
jgi:hypothetical protein